MSRRGAYNARLRKENIPTIQDFCEDAGLTFKFVNGYEWHIRIENVLDVFPTRKRYHNLKTDARGSFEDYDELGRIFLDTTKG